MSEHTPLGVRVAKTFDGLGTHVIATIAAVVDVPAGTVESESSELTANAALIAAAPDLYQSLLEIANHLASLTSRLDGTEAKLYAADLNALNSRVYEARAALAKASTK